MKYYVYYVDDATPVIKTFKTKVAALKFAKKIGNDTEGNLYVEYIFRGSFIYADSYWKRYGIAK